MTEWTRDTRWRQGCVISLDDLRSVGADLPAGCSGGLVITHDCDLANDAATEPVVEWLPFSCIDRLDGNNQYAKNPRVLHLALELEGCARFIQLHAPLKRSLAKQILADFQPASPPLREQSLQILQGWLAARYRRHAFPDELVERMKPLTIFLQKQLKSRALGVLGVWIDYDPRIPLAADEPYELWLYLVYTIDDSQNREQADKLATTTYEQFSQSLPGLVLTDCKAVSEEGFTLADQRRTVEFKLEHLSHRIHPEGSFIE